MPRARRHFEANTSYHVTMRCNNQAFDLRRPLACKALLFCLARAKARFSFRLHGLCVMSNHVHYFIRPEKPCDMPRLMHWLNWYSAMLLNRLLGRCGHFWERRYHAVAVPDRADRHALTVLRYIHGNPLTAGLAPGFRYRYANYASYADARMDGLTDWHPAYLRLGPSLAVCARNYTFFCRRYRPTEKPNSPPALGRLATVGSIRQRQRTATGRPVQRRFAPRGFQGRFQVPGKAGGDPACRSAVGGERILPGEWVRSF